MVVFISKTQSFYLNVIIIINVPSQGIQPLTLNGFSSKVTKGFVCIYNKFPLFFSLLLNTIGKLYFLNTLVCTA